MMNCVNYTQVNIFKNAFEHGIKDTNNSIQEQCEQQSSVAGST